jgi:hypothetical protein
MDLEILILVQTHLLLHLEAGSIPAGCLTASVASYRPDYTPKPPAPPPIDPEKFHAVSQ